MRRRSRDSCAMTPIPAVGRAQIRMNTTRRPRQRLRSDACDVGAAADAAADAAVGRARAHTLDVEGFGDMRQLAAEASPRRRAATADDLPSCWPEAAARPKLQAEDSDADAATNAPPIHPNGDESDGEPGRPPRRRRISFDESEVQVISEAVSREASQEAGARARGAHLEEQGVRKGSDASVQSFGEGPPRKWSDSSEGKGRARANTMHDVESLGTARRRQVCFDEADVVGHEREPEVIGRRPRCHTMHDLDSLASTRDRRLWSGEDNDDLESLVSGSVGRRSGSECMDLEDDDEEAGLLNALAELVVEDDYVMTTNPAYEDEAALDGGGADIATTLTSAGRPRGGSPLVNDGDCAAEDVYAVSIRPPRRPRVGSPWTNHQEMEKDSDPISGNAANHDNATTMPATRRPRVGSPWNMCQQIDESVDATDGAQEECFAGEGAAPSCERHRASTQLSKDGILATSGGPGPLVVLVPLVPFMPVVMLLLMFLLVLLDSWPSSMMSEWWMEGRQPQTRCITEGARKSRGYLTASY